MCTTFTCFRKKTQRKKKTIQEKVEETLQKKSKSEDGDSQSSFSENSSSESDSDADSDQVD